jgi:hypothetical protein
VESQKGKGGVGAMIWRQAKTLLWCFDHPVVRVSIDDYLERIGQNRILE